MAAFALPAASLVSGLISGILGNKASTELAAGSINASNNANSVLNNQYQLTRSDLAPYTTAGQSAITMLSNLLGTGPKPTGSGYKTVGTGPDGAEIQAPTAMDPTAAADIAKKQSTVQFFEDWLAGKNPVDMQGNHLGGPPHNAATLAKVNGQLDQARRELQQAQQMAQNTTNQTNLINQQDPNQYGSLLKDFTASDFDINKDPGAQYRMDQAQKAIERSAAARGGVQSGGTMKALQSNSQDLASQEFQNAYNRFNTNKLNKANLLLGTAGLGQVSLGQQANLGQVTANQVADNASQGITGAANARASGYINTANTANSTIGSLMDLLNMYNKGGGGMSGLPGTGYSTPPFIGNSIPGIGSTKYPTMPALSGSYRAPSLRLN